MANPPYVNDNLARRRRAIPPSAGTATPLFTCSTAISATPILPMTGSAHGGISGRTIAVAPVTAVDALAGNHENELGNGPIGYQAYQTYFSLPPAAARRM